MTQAFNTATSLGRLTLNVLLSFAQFERELTRERTRDKVHAARRKGKWTGGHLVLGYDMEPRAGKLSVNVAEAQQVREMFQIFLRKRSLIQTLEEAEASLMDYEGFVAQGTMLGSGGVILIDDQQNLVKQIARAARFFAHESCAQCTQCREGTAWTTKILERIVAGDGTTEDLDTLLEIAENMTGKTICVLSDSCATPVVSGIKKFRGDFEALIKKKKAFLVPAVA